MGILDGLRALDELPLENHRVFVRLDLDGVLERDVLRDEAPLRRALPTIQKIQRAGARVVLAGRAADAPSLEPIAIKLSELLQTDIFLPDECAGDAARKVVQDLRPTQICLLENLALAPEEAANDDAFARELLRFADVYVNEALSECATRSASIDALPRMVRERGMGYGLAAELNAVARATDKANRPLVLVAGGADPVASIDWLKVLLERANVIVAGGTTAQVLLAARGGAGPSSAVFEAGLLARARSLLDTARERRVKVVLPTEVVAGPSRGALAGLVRNAREIPADELLLDIGPATRTAFAEALSGAKTVLWQGALGAAENPAFDAGTLEFARALAESPAFGLVLGTHTVHALRRADAEVLSKIGFVSAGGRAALDLIEGRRLPGIEALRGGAS